MIFYAKVGKGGMLQLVLMDEALLGIFGMASRGQLLKMLIILEPPGTFGSNLACLFILRLSSNWYICKTLTKFHRASFRSVEVF